ncbi:MAG TPA: hypothetical protein VGY55_12040 [Pirellulales bacterium]|jgi:hypothetical protein|nr:hypothetical protein [Pirellulales bacterium]
MSQPISGKNGFVKVGAVTVAEVTKWSFTKQANSSRYASSGTGGFKRSIPGVKSGSGDVEFKFDLAAASPLVEGAAVTLLLYLDATHFYSVPAIVTRVEVEVDIDSGDVIGGAAHFDSDGAWTEPVLV